MFFIYTLCYIFLFFGDFWNSLADFCVLSAEKTFQAAQSFQTALLHASHHIFGHFKLFEQLIDFLDARPATLCNALSLRGFEDLEPFHPERMASRILGMGDVLTLIEKAEQAISQDEALKLQKKLKENSFNLEDYLTQLESMKKMGNLQDMMSMIPGMSGKLKQFAFRRFAHLA